MDVLSINGNVVDILPALQKKSVQTVVTSPPYFGLRDYGIEKTNFPEISYSPMAGLPEIVVPETDTCLGNEDTLESYTAHLVYIFRLLRDVLADDGTVWLNLGDSYNANYRGGGFDTATDKQSSNTGSTDFYKTKRKPSRLKPKNLTGIPWRVALALQADGWILRSDIIWHKRNPMPESVKDRPTKGHEYLFLLTKNKKYYYDQDSIREESVTEPTTRIKSEEVYGKGTKNFSPGERVWGNSAGRNKRTVWSLSSQPYTEAHFATFPTTLVDPCILAGSTEGDIVLDIFAGSGTVGGVAVKHGRKSILIEQSFVYSQLHQSRITKIKDK